MMKNQDASPFVYVSSEIGKFTEKGSQGRNCPASGRKAPSIRNKKREQIPDGFDLDQLAERSFREAFLATLESGGLGLRNRFHELCLNEISIATLEAIFSDSGQLEDEGVWSSLIFNSAMTEDLLIRLIEQERYLMEIAHRRGPRSVLEKVLEHQPYAEAVITLFQHYYCDDSVSLADFSRYLDKYSGFVKAAHLPKHLRCVLLWGLGHGC